MILKNLHIELRQMLDRISSICSLSGLADILEYCTFECLGEKINRAYRGGDVDL